MKQIKTWALLPLATLCMSSNALAQTTDPWTVTEPTETSKGKVSLPFGYQLEIPGYASATFDMDPAEGGALFSIGTSKYFNTPNVDIFRAGSSKLSGEGSLYIAGPYFEINKGFYIEHDTNNNSWDIRAGRSMNGSGLPYPCPLKFRAEKYEFTLLSGRSRFTISESENEYIKIEATQFIDTTYIPLWLTASEYKFTGKGTMSIDGYVDMQSSLSVNKGIYCENHITSSNLLRVGSTLEGDLSLELLKDTENKAYSISTVGRMGSRYPLNFTASEYKFQTGNVSMEGNLKVGIAAGTQALINADCYMTNYKYLLQLSNYGHNQFSVDDSGNVKSGRSLELGMSEGGHLLIQADAELGTKISNETEGSYFHPFTVDASTYVFNIKGKDTCFAINGGSLNVDGEINCKGKMKVAEINSDQINTKDIKVEMNNAADYVFDESYNLKPLNEVETFVKNEKHLPGIPSASEMAKEGMSVSQMSNLLLEKVEELTLHMIEMQKQIDELKAENQSLKEGMNK